ncbi:MAG: hypothetical protein EBT66_03120 [Bacteroidetes bacterium]|nr:hypothetical protein [Bacteroidota bacterium]NBX63939.1 hypothetical protein [Bacteroidota bacterium]
MLCLITNVWAVHGISSTKNKQARTLYLLLDITHTVPILLDPKPLSFCRSQGKKSALKMFTSFVFQS